MKKVTVVVSDLCHPILTDPGFVDWRRYRKAGLEYSVKDVPGGDFLFLVSCHEVVPQSVRDKYTHTLVLHASDLPKGRGWSPHIWDILGGADHLVVSLIEAADPVDSGGVLRKCHIKLDGTELYDEINSKLFAVELELMSWALDNDQITPEAQHGEPSYYRRRIPADSEIDPHGTIAAQFDLLRVADPDRYPAFFFLDGVHYEISIRKGP